MKLAVWVSVDKYYHYFCVMSLLKCCVGPSIIYKKVPDHKTVNSIDADALARSVVRTLVAMVMTVAKILRPFCHLQTYWGYFSFALRHRYMGCLFNGFNSDLWSTVAVAIICTIASLNGPCYIISGPYLVVSWAVYGGVSPCWSCLYIPPTWPPSSLWSGCKVLLSLWKI